MAKSLQEILTGVHINKAVRKLAPKMDYPFTMADAPVHHLENVPGDPGLVRCACGKWKWRRNDNKPFDESKRLPHLVTCPECLAVMKQREDEVHPDVTVQESTSKD